MRKHQVTLGCLSMVAALVTQGNSASFGEEPSKLKTFNIAPDIVKAWCDTGARFGWMKDKPSQTQDGGGDHWESWREEKSEAAIPAFRLPVKRVSFLFSASFEVAVPVKPLDPGIPFGVDFAHCMVADVPCGSLERLAKLKNLQSLNIGGVGLREKRLKELAGAVHLQSLGIYNTLVTDAGIKELVGLKELKVLDLSGTRVSDAGLKELAKMTELQALNLSYTKVSGLGLKEMAELRSLKLLKLSGTDVTDSGIRHLAGVKKLESLDLSYTLVTDKCLRDLAAIRNLKSLSICATKVTVQGLIKDLAKFERLADLYLDDSEAAKAREIELRKILPNCRFHGAQP